MLHFWFYLTIATLNLANTYSGISPCAAEKKSRWEASKYYYQGDGRKKKQLKNKI